MAWEAGKEAIVELISLLPLHPDEFTGDVDEVVLRCLWG
jgi:hypothetical protein